MHTWFSAQKPGSLLLLLCYLCKSSLKERVLSKRNSKFNPFFFFFLLGCHSTHDFSFGLQQNYKSGTNISLALLKYPWGLQPEWMFGSRRGARTKRHSPLQNEDGKKGIKGRKREGRKNKKRRKPKQWSKSPKKRDMKNYWNIN